MLGQDAKKVRNSAFLDPKVTTLAKNERRPGGEGNSIEKADGRGEEKRKEGGGRREKKRTTQEGTGLVKTFSRSSGGEDFYSFGVKDSWRMSSTPEK